MKPNSNLLEYYGTKNALMNKEAGRLPLSAAIALPILGYLAVQSSKDEMNRQISEEQAIIERNRLIDLARNMGDIQALRNNPQMGSYQQMLYNQAVADNQPMGDLGAFKIAAEVGRSLAKKAGIGSVAANAVKGAISKVPGIGRGSWKSQALTGGLALGAGYGAIKGTGALMGAANKPAQVKVQGAGPALPRYVNQYGQPSL